MLLHRMLNDVTSVVAERNSWENSFQLCARTRSLEMTISWTRHVCERTQRTNVIKPHSVRCRRKYGVAKKQPSAVG